MPHKTFSCFTTKCLPRAGRCVFGVCDVCVACLFGRRSGSRWRRLLSLLRRQSALLSPSARSQLQLSESEEMLIQRVLETVGSTHTHPHAHIPILALYLCLCLRNKSLSGGRSRQFRPLSFNAGEPILPAALQYYHRQCTCTQLQSSDETF